MQSLQRRITVLIFNILIDLFVKMSHPPIQQCNNYKIIFNAAGKLT